MLEAVAVIGGLVLIAAAIVIGWLEARAQSSAWERIATARRINVERADALDVWESRLRAWEHGLRQGESDL
ncbi:hypothetical protein [Pseudonocardia lacus]|uniref:hypothetical protein n=1 Tax=Pseudonocardia lacus TaxID=2835865 RepID=UPI001BDD0991|nr:hypothetical protein [Pseudonocardia lacus]